MLKFLTAMVLKPKLLIVLLSILNCTSTPKLQQHPPVEFGEVYYQRWNAGIQEKGHGYRIYIPVKQNTIPLDSVYFRGNSSKLVYNKTTHEYIGAIKANLEDNSTEILNNHHNKDTTLSTPPIPFQLKANACVVTYVKDGKTQYFKIDKMIQKQVVNYPSAPPN